MARNSFVAVTILGIALAVSCSATTLRDTWIAKDFTGGPLRNVLVVGLSAEPTNRRTFEDTLVSRLGAKKVKATASYTVMTGKDLPKEADLRAIVKEKGYDGVFVSRVVGEETRTSYSPGVSMAVPMYGSPFYGYYGGWYTSAYSPGYMVSEKVVNVETTVWSTQGEGKLIWSGISETVSPPSIPKACDELAIVVVDNLWQAKLL